MAKFKKKPVVIEASQWFKEGDHLAVENPMRIPADIVESIKMLGCDHCGTDWECHGWVDTLERGHLVCPGDWIITGVEGEHYPCKPDIFKKTYDPVPSPSCCICHSEWVDVDNGYDTCPSCLAKV